MSPGRVDPILEAKLLRTATSFVRWWGLCPLESVLGRVEVITSTAADAASARRALDQCPQLRWLDEHHQWFSMATVPSSFEADLCQLFAIANPLSFNELHHNLLRSRPGARQLPTEVLKRYLEEIVGATLLGDVAILPRHEALSLDPIEAAMVRALLDVGGELERKELIRRATSEPHSERLASRLLQRSLLIVPTDRRRVHLFGHSRLDRKTRGVAGIPRGAPDLSQRSH